MPSPKKSKPRTTWASMLDDLGIEAICERIENGDSQMEIAADLGMPRSTLCQWLSRPEHAERAEQARQMSAEAWLDKGLDVIKQALPKGGDIDPSAAKAYAQECARRAALRNPRYVEKTAHEHTGAGGGPLIAVVERRIVRPDAGN